MAQQQPPQQQPPPQQHVAVPGPYSAQTAYSPQAAHSPPPASQYTPQQQYHGSGQHMAEPPIKRQRLSPGPGSPYVQPPTYAGSPGAQSNPPSAGPSPHFSNAQIPPNAYNGSTSTNGTYSTPYSQNGHNNSSASSQFNAPPQSPLGYPGAGQYGQQDMNTSAQSPHAFNGATQFNQQDMNNNYMMQSQVAGTMGPPSKPAEKAKEDGVDPMDVLGGTGIDLREEEQYSWQNASFNTQQNGHHSGFILPGQSYSQFPPGTQETFYGSGPANQTPESANDDSQAEYERKAAELAWKNASRDLALSRQLELNNPFLQTGQLHQRFAKIARENGVELRTEALGGMGRFLTAEQFPSPTVKTNTTATPDGIISTTSGNFLPYDSLLVDQLVLLSFATKHRLRELIGDAARLARERRQTSDGEIPEAWADIAVQSSTTGAVAEVEGAPRSGWESAIDPLSALPSQPTVPVYGKLRSQVSAVLRAEAAKERDFEEERIKKRIARQARQSSEGTARQGSVIPGTPGSIAPEPIDKVPTKKEQRKKTEAKTSEAASRVAANNTTALFTGGGGGIFGKKKGKGYSWLTGTGNAGGSSGSSTPRQRPNGLPGTPSPSVNTAPERLTADGVRKLGNWREKQDKGRGIQLRDWVCVLENDGRAAKALQEVYPWMDSQEPK